MVGWHFYSPICGYRFPRPTKTASRSLALYGGMIADDIVAQCRVATLIETLDATLVALSHSTTEPSFSNETNSSD
jgi:hypothetical protein